MKTFSGNLITALPLFVALFEFAVTTPIWYTAGDGNEYFIEDEAKYNWLQAYDECVRQDLQLVIIDNAAKNDALDALLRKVFENAKDLWLGHHDEFNSKKDTDRPFYSIVTGEQLSFANWNLPTAEPNNQNNNEHCVQIKQSTDFKWNDYPCHIGQFGYICEKGQRTANCGKDMEEIRQTAYAMNSQLFSDYANKRIEIQQILEDTRNVTANMLVDLKQSTTEIIAKSKNSIDAMLRRKPYLQAVIADVGDDFKAIIIEAVQEIAAASSEVQQSIENIHQSAGGSISGISSDFGEQLGNNVNAIDKLFV